MGDDFGFILAIVGFVIGGLALLFMGDSGLARFIGSLITASLIVFAFLVLISVIMTRATAKESP